jgi:hypothetical protein
MVLSTAFDRQRGRRRGFGKQQTTADDDCSSGLLAAVETAEMEESLERVEEDEPTERLWSDPEESDPEEEDDDDAIDNRSHYCRSNQTILLASETDPVADEEEEEVGSPSDLAVLNTETEDHVSLAAAANKENDDHDETPPTSPATLLVVRPNNVTVADRQEVDHDDSTAGLFPDDRPQAHEETSATMNRATDDDETESSSKLAKNANTTTTTSAREEPSKKAPKKKKKTKNKSGLEKVSAPVLNLDIDDVLASTEQWFDQVTDKKAVTVSDIVKSLCLEYDCVDQGLPKAIKKAVRGKLTELMAEDQEKDDQQEEEEDIGDNDDEESSIEGDAESSGNDDDQSMGTSRRNKQPTTTQRRKKKDITKPNKASTKLAQKIHTQQQRKRQLESERVVNEELNALQSKQDEAVGDAIASALELIQDTLPQRLELLSKLDEKRLGCLRDFKSPSPDKQQTQSAPIPKSPAVDEDDQYSSSDDEMELEIEGPIQSLGQHLVPLLRSPPRKAKSPVKNNRAALRARLLQQQRTMGNQWLARELGYKNEQEHLQDCRAAELEKRRKIQQLEEAKAAQRALQRERLLKGVVDAEADSAKDDDHESPEEETMSKAHLSSQDSADEDDDEELLLAKELEKESPSGTTFPESADCNDEAESSVPDDETEPSDESAKELEKESPSGTTFPESADCNDEAESSAPADAMEPSEESQTFDQPQTQVAGNDETESSAPDDLDHAAAVKAATEPSDKSQALDQPQTQLADDSVPPDVSDLPICIAASAVSEPPLAINNGISRDSTKVDADLNSSPQTLQLLTESLPLDSNPSSSGIDNMSEKVDTVKSDRNVNASTVADLLEFADVEDDDDDDERPYETQQADTAAVVTDECDPNDCTPIQPQQEAANVEKPTFDPEVLAKRKREKNLMWKAILEKDKKMARKKNKSSLVEDEADEEEEEAVAGLEDFGFIVKKKKDDDEVEPDGEYNEDDLENVVDELSDNEGDEDAGEKARKVMERKEEKLRHKEMMRRMREGYDGRRGGITGGGTSRGLHRFDQLVAADNREDAKRLGLLNDDEIDSEDDEKGSDEKAKDDEEEDEAALLDKIIKDRFLHRSSVLENFDEDDDGEGGADDVNVQDPDDANKGLTQEQLEELEQEELAKRFSKRARMTRLVETHGDNEEFSQSRLIDEDKSMLTELLSMKVCVFVVD